MAYEEVYVSLERGNYKKNKSNLLNCQAGLLRSLKHLNNLAIISRQKVDLRKRILKIASSINSEVKSLDNKFSIIQLPKEYKKETKENILKRNSIKQDSIDAELQMIQQKLQILNEM